MMTSKSAGDPCRATKDGRGRKSAPKGVLRASERVRRVSVGPVHRWRHKINDSYNTEQYHRCDQKSHLHIVVLEDM